MRNARPVISSLWLLRALAAFLVLPNLVVGIAAFALRADWHPVNVDYLIAGVLLALGRRMIGISVFAAILILDLLLTLAPIFHFDAASTPQGIAQLLGAMPMMTVAIAIPAIIGAFALAWIAASIAAWPGGSHWLTRVSFIACAPAILLIDAMNGSNQLLHSEGTRIPLNLAGSSLFHVSSAIREARDEAARRHGSLQVTSTAGATSNLREALASEPLGAPDGAQHISLVLVESLGALKDGHADSLLLAPLLAPDVAARYQVRLGRAPFDGPTTAGEFRELCGVVATYLSVPDRLMDRCLPELLARRGFRAVSIHGFRSGFFDRNEWYPRVGFERMLFGDEASLSSRRRCGVLFRGACDDDVARVYARELLDAPPGEHRFVYWLTLSSHFPVDASAAVGSDFACADATVSANDATLCSLMRIWSKVIEDVRRIALDPRLARTRFVLVGDHSPPFVDPSHASLFDQRFVPFVELIPKPVGGVAAAPHHAAR